VYRILFVLATLAAAAPAAAQTPEDDVLAVISRLFEAMHAKDEAAILATMDTSAALVRLAGGEGGQFVSRSSAAAFARAIAGIPADQEIEERFWEPEVRVDGNLATAWMPYAFLLNGAIRHCGVDAFQLMRFRDGWKIIQIADTMRRDGCALPH
jgi:glycosyltransferase involved in cell wall biosynthesis